MWRKAINYWELYHEKAVKLKEYMYIVFTSFIFYSSSIKLKKCVYAFPTPPRYKKNP